MTVGELLKLLTSLGEVLKTSGAKAVGDELQDLAVQMRPLSEYKLKAFADLVVRVAAPPKTKLSPQGAVDILRRLYERALEPDITVESIRTTVNQFGDMTKAQLDETAKLFEITRNLKTKGDVLKALAQRIIDRKGAHERAGL